MTGKPKQPKKRTHPFRAWTPGWLKSDRNHKALPGKPFRVIPR